MALALDVTAQIMPMFLREMAHAWILQILSVTVVIAVFAQTFNS